MPIQEIETIKQQFVEHLSPRRIYLFGSFAKGTQREDSDFDFYIVMPDDSGNRNELLRKAYRLLKGLKRRSVDIVLNYESSFQERASENTLEKIVQKEGILLYGE